MLAGCGGDGGPGKAPQEPPQRLVLQGTITGLGSVRPLVLQYNGQDECLDSSDSSRKIPCRFLGVLGQAVSTFSFGSLPTGTVYNITVKVQPFGKICTVQNATGTLTLTSAVPAITCVNDPAVPRYPVTVTIDPAVAATPDVRVKLSTEEGVQERPATGETTLTFPDAIFNSQSDLPIFKWFVTATTTAGSTVNNCNVANGTNESFTAGQDVTQPPTGPADNVQVTLCSFTVTASVAYQAAAGQPALAMPGGGMALGLRRSRTGEIERTAELADFSTAQFTNVPSNRDAMHELVITRHPQGMTCLVGSASQYQWGSAVLLLNPQDANRSPSHGWVINRNVRCRSNPATGAQLVGSYRISIVGDAGVQPTRNFLTFFDDGTYLYGHHAIGTNCGIGCGVEQGFYVYDSAAGSIGFNPVTDTTGTTGLSTTSTGVAVATPLTNVQRTPGPAARIDATVGSVTWRLLEPEQVAGQMAGAWATADHRRVWIYEAGTYNGFHAGVNGLGNAQDGCYNIETLTALSGFYTRRGNGTTCELGPGYFTLDVPNILTVPRFPEGFIGKWPQSTSNADGRPSSPVNFDIVPGEPDMLRVRETVNGAETLDGVTPVSPEIVLFRIRAN
ncbi:MAG: hypothetical protein M3Y79_06390 [Pseudomonadota bacterium]|nr:hypothetical protein [Pseudomonadota bacterium]